MATVTTNLNHVFQNRWKLGMLKLIAKSKKFNLSEYFYFENTTQRGKVWR